MQQSVAVIFINNFVDLLL